jgi:hypothetical protein
MKKNKYPAEKRNEYAAVRFTQLTNMCFKKATFRTEEQAKLKAVAYGHRIYLCPNCNKYHLTSKGVV